MNNDFIEVFKHRENMNSHFTWFHEADHKTNCNTEKETPQDMFNQMSSILSDIFQSMYGRSIIIAPDLLKKLGHFVKLQFNPFVYRLSSCLQ